MNKFIARKNELDFLEQKYESKNGQLVIIYGRRRIGKTETIKHFCKDKGAIFFTCTQTEDNNQLRNFSSLLLSNNLPQSKYISEFNSWEQAFLVAFLVPAPVSVALPWCCISSTSAPIKPKCGLI